MKSFANDGWEWLGDGCWVVQRMLLFFLLVLTLLNWEIRLLALAPKLFIYLFIILKLMEGYIKNGFSPFKVTTVASKECLGERGAKRGLQNLIIESDYHIVTTIL